MYLFFGSLSHKHIHLNKIGLFKFLCNEGKRGKFHFLNQIMETEQPFTGLFFAPVRSQHFDLTPKKHQHI